MCWGIGMVAVYADLAHRGELLVERKTEAARAGRLQAVVAPPPTPAVPETPPPPASAPAHAPAVPTDVNVVTDVLLDSEPGSRPPALSLKIRYTLAKGKTAPPKVRSYYIAEIPAVVLELSGIWKPVEDFGQTAAMPQVAGVTFFAAPHHLRLVLRTKTLRQAEKARVDLAAGPDAAVAKIHFPE